MRPSELDNVANPNIHIARFYNPSIKSHNAGQLTRDTPFDVHRCGEYESNSKLRKFYSDTLPLAINCVGQRRNAL